MLDLSKRTLQILCVTGFALAGAGWYKALTHEAAAPAGVAAAGERETQEGRGDRRKAAGPKLASDPRSIRLMELMGKLDGDAEPGAPNPTFVKAAVLTLEDSLYHRRQRDFRLLMEKMRPEDARAIHEHFLALERKGRYFGPEYEAFAMRWGQVDGEGAMAFWTAREPFDLKPHDMANLVTGWANSAPEKALAWIEGNRELLGDMNAYRPLVVGWLASDPVAAGAWLSNAKLTPHEYVDCVSGAALDKVYSDGVEGASEWLASLPQDDDHPADAAKVGWMLNIGRLGNLDPGLAAGAWSKVGSKAWMNANDFQSFCNSVANGNGGSLEGFAEQLSTKWPAAEAGNQFARWTESNPEVVGAILARLPASGIRDAGVEAMLGTLEKTAPEQVDGWRKELSQ
jgi:hypothetical protein